MRALVNISEISRHANVSRTTVSRVLNGHPYVTSEKREAVLLAIKELNYVPNYNAIHLSKGKTDVLGVMVPHLNHPFFNKLMEGIGRVSSQYNYSLLVCQTNNEPEKEIEFFKRLRYKLIDGLIIGSTVSPISEINEASKFGPIVSCEHIETESIIKVIIEHQYGVELAIQHLHQKGHRKIGICLGNPMSGVGRTRKSAFFHCKETYSLIWDDHWYFDHAYTIEDGRKIMKKLMTLHSIPSALFVGNDYVASGIIYEAKAMGLSIPSDLAVVGFDNQPIAEVMELTTIHQPIKELGEQAVRHLHAQIKNDEKLVSTLKTNALDLELKIRNTT